jgi:hypothetical protein
VIVVGSTPWPATVIVRSSRRRAATQRPVGVLRNGSGVPSIVDELFGAGGVEDLGAHSAIAGGG